MEVMIVNGKFPGEKACFRLPSGKKLTRTNLLGIKFSTMFEIFDVA